MFKEKEVASEINELVLDCSKKLNTSLFLVKDKCSEEEFKQYRYAVGKIMGDILIDVMYPIYQQHPDLKPKELE